jgi:nicotinamidase/pyrazinamidase
MRTVFVDVDTQLDFLYPAGALYVPGAERILPVIERLNRYAASHQIPVLSTTDAHGEDDPEFRDWPPHCVAGTIGQHKPAGTLLERRIAVPNSEARMALDAPQILLEKQTIDAFATRSLPWVLDLLEADQFVVYGVVAEICVLCAARGLLRRGKRVTVVADAVQALSEERAAHAFDEIRKSGGAISRVAEVCVG